MITPRASSPLRPVIAAFYETSHLAQEGWGKDDFSQTLCDVLSAGGVEATSAETGDLDLVVDGCVGVVILPETRRLAIKSRLQKVEPIAGKSIPFFDYPSLGSSYDLRGYPSDRYRDDGSLMITMEYRYPIWNFADIVLFVDEGQVFNQFSDIKFNKFHTGYGFGFHIISTKGFAFRTEFAFSEDYTRLILSINPNF